MYEPQKSIHNKEDTNSNNNNNHNQEEQSSVVEAGGIGSTFNTTDSSIRAPSPHQPPLINNYFQSQPNTASSTNNIKVDNSSSINVDNIFASITDEVATTTTTTNNYNHNNSNIANVNSNNIFQNFATHTNSSSMMQHQSTATSNIPFRKYSDSNYNHKGNMIPASNCIAPIDNSQYNGSNQGASSRSDKKELRKATLDRSESDGTSDKEIGEILTSKSYDARSFLRPGVNRNMSERYVYISVLFVLDLSCLVLYLWLCFLPVHYFSFFSHYMFSFLFATTYNIQ